MAPGDEIPGDNFVAADAGPSSLVRLPICSGVANNATQTMETGNLFLICSYLSLILYARKKLLAFFDEPC